MTDRAFADVVSVVRPGFAWVPTQRCEILEQLDLGPDKLIRLRNEGGAERVVWFLGPAPHRIKRPRRSSLKAGGRLDAQLTTTPVCDICGHLIHPDEPTRCLNCGNDVPRDPQDRVLDS